MHDLDLDLLRRLYVDERLTCAQIAQQLNVSHGAIYDRLKAMGVMRDQRASHIGQKAWNKGTSYKNLLKDEILRLGGETNYLRLLRRWYEEHE